MKKLIFVAGVIVSGVLFFVGGVLSGYFVGAQNVLIDESDEKCKNRQPSKSAILEIHGDVVSDISSVMVRAVSVEMEGLKSKNRSPSDQAVSKSKIYSPEK